MLCVYLFKSFNIILILLSLKGAIALFFNFLTCTNNVEEYVEHDKKNKRLSHDLCISVLCG